MFTAGNLITLALCVGILLIFRQLDSNNKSIDKVKKYIDHAKADMDNYFEGRNQSLKDAAVDLDTKQEFAVAAVKRLEKFETDFVTRAQQTEDRIQSLGEIEKKISSYDETIRKLIEMTSRAEENLENLSTQSKRFDATFKKIKELQDKVAQTEAALPGLTENFAKQNMNQLQEIGAHLLDDYNSRTSKISEQYDIQIQKCNQLFKQIDDQIQSSFDTATHKASVLEDSVFEQLQNQQNQRKNDYIATVNQRNEELRKNLETQIAETQDIAKKFRSQLQLEMSNYEESIRAEMQNISSKFQDTIQTLDSRVAEFERTSVNRIDEFNARLDSNDQRIELTFSDTERQINNIKEDIKQNIKSVAAALEDLNGEFAAKTSELQGNFADVEAKLQSTADEKIKEIESALHGQIAGLENQVSSSYAQISDDLNAKNTELLSEIATRFETYKADVMYRFKAFDRFSADAEQLEEQLRRSMNDVRTGVVNDFEAFATEQQAKQNTFEKNITEGTQALSQELVNVENELEALKQKATGNVSEQLQNFEENFFRDLNKKGESLNVELDNWINNMEAKLNNLASATEDDRRKIELQYLEDMKTRLADFETRFKEQTGNFEVKLSELDNSLQEKLGEYEQSINSFSLDAKKQLDAARASSDEHIKAELETHASEIQEQVEKQKRELAAQIKAVFADVDSTREKTETSLEAVRSDFSTWSDRLNQQCAEYKESFDERLAGMQTNANDLIAQVGSSFKMDVENYIAKVREEKEHIKNEMDDLRTQMDRSVNGYNTRAEEMTAEFKKSYEMMLEENAQKIREQNLEADQKMRELKSQAQEIREQTEAAQEKMRIKLQTDANAINMTMDDLDKRLKSFVSQTQLFDKADELKEQLEGDISALRTEIDSLKK